MLNMRFPTMWYFHLTKPQSRLHMPSLIRAFASCLIIFMSVKLLTAHHLGVLSLKGGCTGSSESTLVKMPHCWKSHVEARIVFVVRNPWLVASEQQIKGADLILFSHRLKSAFVIVIIWGTTCAFQQCGNLTNVDSNEPVQLFLSLETPNDIRAVA